MSKGDLLNSQQLYYALKKTNSNKLILCIIYFYVQQHLIKISNSKLADLVAYELNQRTANILRKSAIFNKFVNFRF